MPVRMQPRSGHGSDAPECGQVIRAHIAPLHTTDGATDWVAARALYRATTLAPLAPTKRKGITRVPATLSAAPAVLADADPPTMTPLAEGSRDHALTSTDGGVAQRWGRIDAVPRPPQAQRPVDKPLRQPRDPAVTAVKQ
jgi:hypothetical protein